VTTRSATDRNTATPSGLEAEVLRLLWRLGPATAEQVREQLTPGRPLKDSTIRTLLRRLTVKGFAKHEMVGRSYVYEARVQPGAAAAQAVRRIIDRFCGGSVEQLLVGLVDGEVVGDKELQAIAGKIAAAKTKRRK
jgi:BlaI family transcriptional regulator, penicillinase repressor